MTSIKSDPATIEIWLVSRTGALKVEKSLGRHSVLGPDYIAEAGKLGRIHAIGKTAFLKPDEALAAAEQERSRRIAELERQIARLRAADLRSST